MTSKRSPSTLANQLDSSQRTASPRRSALRARDGKRDRADVHARHPRVDAGVLHGQRDRAAAGADVEHARPPQRRAAREHGFDAKLGLGPWNEHRGVYRERQRVEVTRAGEVCDGLAPRAARDERGERTRGGRRDGALRKREQRAARTPGRQTRAAVQHRAAVCRSRPRDRARRRPAARTSQLTTAGTAAAVGGAAVILNRRGPARRADRRGTRSRAARSRRRDRPRPRRRACTA